MSSTKDWRDDVYVSTLAYVFQSALYCEECGDKIKNRLSSKADTGDSNDYPQGPYNDGGGEADSPQFCDSGKACSNKVVVPSGTSIGCPLGNPLTRDGIKEINETVRSLAFANHIHSRAVSRLYALLYGPQGHNVLTDEIVEIVITDGLRELPQSLQRALQEDKNSKQLAKLYVDINNLYYVSVGKHNETIVGRVALNPDGSYGKPEVVKLPGSELNERSAMDIVRTCVEDVAWD
jgi:hypothetical protein